MITSPHIKQILQWYSQHRRDLPWRRTADPYKILVSEIMLQQTQVSRVLEKYKEFLGLFPTVFDLANAKTSQVITAWKGLGYNRRALYLQKGAQAVTDQYNGKYPDTIEALVALPGIGDYTSRAIMSFAFDKPVPMMDTNHRKFYQRICFGENKVDDKVLLDAAYDIVGRVKRFKNPVGDTKSTIYHWNQAIMDFGSQFLSRNGDITLVPIKNFDTLYPEPFVLKKKKKAIPFKHTDRYIRGRIIDELREKGSMSKQTISRRFSNIDVNRRTKIVDKLSKDGLILVEKGRIVLP